MKKILFIFLGLNYSGAEMVLEKYIKGNISIDPYFVVLYNETKVNQIFCERYGKDKIINLELRYNKNILRFLPILESERLVRKLHNVISVINPDIIYANNTLETMLIGLKKRNINIPIIGHIHDMSYGIKSPIKKICINRAIKNIESSITVSKACQRSWKGIKKVIYNGIDKGEFNYSKINSISNIGYVGALSYRKGFDVFLEFCKCILEREKKVKIHIVYSEGTDNKYLSDLNEIISKFPENIIVKKNLNKNEMTEFYNKIDLLVVPSRNDPFPTVILEAMSKGRLVIGSNVDGIPELLQYNEKLLFNKNNFRSIEKLFNYLTNISTEELNKLGLELYNNCKNVFKNEEKTKRINSIIYELNFNKKEG